MSFISGLIFGAILGALFVAVYYMFRTKQLNIAGVIGENSALSKSNKGTSVEKLNHLNSDSNVRADELLESLSEFKEEVFGKMSDLEQSATRVPDLDQQVMNKPIEKIYDEADFS